MYVRIEEINTSQYHFIEYTSLQYYKIYLISFAGSIENLEQILVSKFFSHFSPLIRIYVLNYELIIFSNIRGKH